MINIVVVGTCKQQNKNIKVQKYEKEKKKKVQDVENFRECIQIFGSQRENKERTKREQSENKTNIIIMSEFNQFRHVFFSFAIWSPFKKKKKKKIIQHFKTTHSSRVILN